MGENPSFYFDIGKHARAVLHSDHIQATPTSRWSFDLSCEDLAPRLKTGFRILVPDSSKITAQYEHKYGGIAGGIDPSLRPTLRFSTLLGSSCSPISLGSEVTVESSPKPRASCNLGLSLNTNFLITSLNFNEGHAMKASCYRALVPETSTAVAAEIAHSFKDKDHDLIIGAQHLLFPGTMVKARVNLNGLNLNGRFGAIVQHRVLPSLFVTLGGELEITPHQKGAKLGFSVALHP